MTLLPPRSFASSLLVAALASACGGPPQPERVDGALLTREAARILGVTGDRTVLVARDDGSTQAVVASATAPAPFDARDVTRIEVHRDAAAFVDARGAGVWTAAAGTRLLGAVASLPAITSDRNWVAYFARSGDGDAARTQVVVASLVTAQSPRVVVDDASVGGACASSLHAVGERIVVLRCAAPDAAAASVIVVEPSRPEPSQARTIVDAIAPALFAADPQTARIAVERRNAGVAIVSLADGSARPLALAHATALHFLDGDGALLVRDDAGLLFRFERVGDATATMVSTRPCRRLISISPDGTLAACEVEDAGGAPVVALVRTRAVDDPQVPLPSLTPAEGITFRWSGDGRTLLAEDAAAAAIYALDAATRSTTRHPYRRAVRALEKSLVAAIATDEEGASSGFILVEDLAHHETRPRLVGPVVEGEYAPFDSGHIVWIGRGEAPGLYLSRVE